MDEEERLGLAEGGREGGKNGKTTFFSLTASTRLTIPILKKRIQCLSLNIMRQFINGL